jgi:hypothetical protein
MYAGKICPKPAQPFQVRWVVQAAQVQDGRRTILSPTHEREVSIDANGHYRESLRRHAQALQRAPIGLRHNQHSVDAAQGLRLVAR